MKTQSKKCTPQNNDPRLLQDIDLALIEEEDTGLIFPLEPEDLSQCYSPDVLEFLG